MTIFKNKPSKAFMETHNQTMWDILHLFDIGSLTLNEVMSLMHDLFEEYRKELRQLNVKS